MYPYALQKKGAQMKYNEVKRIRIQDFLIFVGQYTDHGRLSIAN